MTADRGMDDRALRRDLLLLDLQARRAAIRGAGVPARPLDPLARLRG